MTNRDSLRRLLQPRSIAVVGGGVATAVIRQCDKIGFAGEIWPVNNKREEMVGRRCYASLAELPGVPDATFIGVPRETTVTMVAQLAEMGAGGVVCYASGFAEIGEVGQRFQAQLQARMGELALVGPNCYGLLNYLDGVALWPDEQGGKRVEKGVAIISQSGNISLNLTMQQRGVPLAYLIATGNQAGATVPEYIEALLEDERVTAIGIHLEGLADVAAFSRAALLALQKGVPIVVLKSGSSALGGWVTMSHTSSLAGADALYEALLARLGVVRVSSVPQFLETLKFLAVVGVLPNNSIASISCSGGEAALVADGAERLGLTMPALLPHQQEALLAVLGERVALGNPLDYHTYIWGDGAAQEACFGAMMLGEQAVTLKVLDFPRPDICNPADWVLTAEAFARAATKMGKHGAVVATMPENLPESLREWLLAQGVVPMLGLTECLEAVRGAALVGERQRVVGGIRPLPNPSLKNGKIITLDEAQSKELLARYGIAVPPGVVCDEQTAVSAAKSLGYPVVVKVLSSEIVHKSDVGGVVVNVKGATAVLKAVYQMRLLSDRVLIEKMGERPLVEMILGITRDPQFGLALVIGAGGILVELFQDSQTLLFPVLRHEVEAALDSLKIAPLLNGYRGQAGADKAALVEAVMNLARLAEDFADSLVEVDVNPLFVYGDGVLAVDGVIRMVD
ncbi:MAG: acetate--CoA ligase family protein [Ardenticatenaceae bacterium]|nr:acetate--CoA ligase family protein [Ardenticatenaceae bacterium]